MEATPAGVDVALGAVVIVAAALAAGLVPVSSTVPRLGLMAAALFLFAAATVDLRAVVVVTITAYLVFDGFLVNQLGELSWRGAADTRRLAVLGLAAALGLVAGLGYDGVAVQCATFGEDYSKGVITPVRGDAPATPAVPADAVTASGSGLDPQISPAYAKLQVARVARARAVEAAAVQKLVDDNTTGRGPGFMGRPAVNVVRLNIDLDRIHPFRG